MDVVHFTETIFHIKGMLIQLQLDWSCCCFYLDYHFTFVFTRYDVMLKCWEEQPTDRPTFETLRKTMKQMERNHKVRRRLLETINFIGEEKKGNPVTVNL